MMKVLLVRTRPRNILAKLGTVRFEPLELEYLAAAVEELNFQWRIYDGLIEKTGFSACLAEYRPDVVAITGYTIHVNIMKSYADTVKKYCPWAVTVAGGVHAELNWEDFYHPGFDVVVHANPVVTFKRLLLALAQGVLPVDLANTSARNNGVWHKNPAEDMDPDQLPRPERSHLNIHKGRFRYFGKEECAIVKTAWGCRHHCSFCYCSRLNGGRYTARAIAKVMEEIGGLAPARVFIVDDNFLSDRVRVEEFCRQVKHSGINKRFSIYGRADSVLACEDLLPHLKEAGVEEVIVGLEAVSDDVLEKYQKQTTVHLNYRAVDLLQRHGIACCGLFIVNQDYDRKDFTALTKAVREMKPAQCMFSIYTPLKGLPDYEKYRGELSGPADCYEKMDFLHLVLRPTRLSPARFYFEFYKLYALAYLDRRRLAANFLPLMRSLVNLVLSLRPPARFFTRPATSKKKGGKQWLS